MQEAPTAPTPRPPEGPGPWVTGRPRERAASGKWLLEARGHCLGGFLVWPPSHPLLAFAASQPR